MRERDHGLCATPREAKEIPQQGELYFLWHPGTEDAFSGYGLVTKDGFKDYLVGILMVDRPRPADPEWLKEVEEAYGQVELVPMTAGGERGIVCQMWIEPDSLPHLRQYPGAQTAAIKTALEPLLTNPPEPTFALRWDEEARVWCSQFAGSPGLPREIQEAFERAGHGCLAAETYIGVIHICHAADNDIEGFANKPVLSQWQLIEMPTAPLIRLELVIQDQPDTPYLFESFLNLAEEDQVAILAQLTGQDRLYLAFHGDDFSHRFTKIIEHDDRQRQQLDELVCKAKCYWARIPTEHRDFDQAKAAFMRWFV
jgi:hypothetical protein